MNKEQRDARQAQYEAWLDELDADNRQLEAKERAEFEDERDNFKGQVSAWKDSAEAHWDELEAKLSGKWNEMKEKWHARKND